MEVEGGEEVETGRGLTVVRLADTAHLELDEDLVLLGLRDGVVLAARDGVLRSARPASGASRSSWASSGNGMLRNVEERAASSTSW